LRSASSFGVVSRHAATVSHSSTTTALRSGDGGIDLEDNIRHALWKEGRSVSRPACNPNHLAPRLHLQMLDGPYIAFVTSVKLESAFLAISHRDKQSEDQQAQLEQQPQRSRDSLSANSASLLKSTSSDNDLHEQRDQV
jgi:hypothetical protein